MLELGCENATVGKNEGFKGRRFPPVAGGRGAGRHRHYRGTLPPEEKKVTFIKIIMRGKKNFYLTNNLL